MYKLRFSLFVVGLICLGLTHAASLEWPANLIALSTGKSSQAALPLQLNEDSAELSTENSANAVPAAEQSAEEVLTESSSGSSEPLDAARAVPVSVPLPLILASRAGLRTVLTIQEPTLAKLGNLVEHVPTAVSHQSQTVVHDHRRLVTPIVAPAVRTTQVVRQHPPLIWTVAADPRLVLLRSN